MNNKRLAGFTLLEILIALFIFTILSMMMTGALHTVINADSGAERSAERLRELQITLVRISRDVEQIVNRPVQSNDGQSAAAFYGTTKGFTFTHGGLAGQSQQHHVLQRTQYNWHENSLWRMASAVLDPAPNSPGPSRRRVLANVTDAQFEYLDDKKNFTANWPAGGGANKALPRAIRMTLTLKDWGTIRQIYVIPAQNIPLAVTLPTA